MRSESNETNASISCPISFVCNLLLRRIYTNQLDSTAKAKICKAKVLAMLCQNLITIYLGCVCAV